MALSKAFVWGDGGAALTPEELAQARLMEARALAKGIDTSPVGHWSQGAARVADAIAGAFRRGALDKAGAANEAYDADLLSSISGAAFPSSVAEGGSTFAPDATGVPSGVSAGSVDVSPEIRDGIVQTAAAVGIDPVDLATAISYETGGTFDPTKAGPTTKYGQHRGLIQFGEPQAAQYGVDWNNPVGSQLGENGAVAKYLRASGVKPGMGLLDVYSAINAGAPGLYNRSDAAAGGAPGTVADKVNQQMAGHRAKALALFGNQQLAPAAAAINAVAPVQVASLSPDAGMAAALPEGGGAIANSPSMIPAPGATPYSGPGAQTGQPMLVYDDKGMRMEDPDAAVPVGVAGVQPGQPMAQPPAQDVTQVPALSSGADIPMVGPTGQPSPIAAAINQPALSPAVQQVSAALPIRPQADPNDIMVAGRDQTVQPQIPTGAPAAAPARSGPSPQALIRAMTDPRASPRTRQVAEVLYKQQAAQAQAQYEAQLQANDPKRQLEIQKLQREVNEPRKRNTATIGNTVVDLDTGKPIYEGQEKPTSTIQEYEYARQQGYTGDFVQFNLDQKKATATTIDLREPGGEGKKFYEKLDEGNAKIYSDLSQAGVQARSTQGMTKQLAERLKNAPQGAAGALAQLAGEWGIKTEGSSDIEAATALINRLVPQQRQPGSGTMSDADLELFKASLPRILNSKGGNEMIINDLNAISEYQIKMGEIADRVADRELTPSEGREEIRKLANPLSNFLERDRAEKLDEQDNGWKEISPGVKVRPIQ